MSYPRPMQRLTVCGPNLGREAKATFHVHNEGCADLSRGVCRGAIRDGEAHTAAYSSLTEVCDAVYPPEDFQCESGEYLFDFYFAPCVKLAVG
jgi:hypothetical protein